MAQHQKYLVPYASSRQASLNLNLITISYFYNFKYAQYTKVIVSIRGAPSGLHGLHIHQFGITKYKNSITERKFSLEK